MIETLITVGTWALGLVGGPLGILGLLGGLFRIPWIGGAAAAIPIVGPLLVSISNVVLGWLDAVVRFLARSVGAFLKAVSADYRVAVPIIVLMWGYHLYYDKWKYRNWESPAAVSVLKRDVVTLEKETKTVRPSKRKAVVRKPAPTFAQDIDGFFRGLGL